MNNQAIRIQIVFVGILLSIGLILPIFPALANMNSPSQIKPTVVSLTGTIHKRVVEKACYQLTAENGQNYELIGKFPKRDGVKVKVSGIIATDIVTICQVGQPFKVKSIQVLK